MKKLIPINASSWSSHENDRYTYYYSGVKTSFDENCSKIYRPFAWLRFDRQENKLKCGRDHFGQEPFYYSLKDNKFIFGSTIPDILKYLKEKPAITEHLERDIFNPQNIVDPLFQKETYYKGIFRITPGHMMSWSDGKIEETCYWQICPKTEYLHYKDEAEYLQQFSELLTASVRELTEGFTTVAAECSGGLDSTSILVACRSIGLEPKLFTNTLPGQTQEIDESINVVNLLDLFDWRKNHQYINADSTDPIEIFRDCAKLFAGPPPYWLGMFNTPLHNAVSSKNIPVLLSGLGGDECFSLRCPPHYGLAERHKKNGYYATTKEYFGYNCSGSLQLRTIRLLQFIAHSHVAFYHTGAILSYGLGLVDKRFRSYQKHKFYESLKLYQLAVLQGHQSHELRMKIEYDAVLAKQNNFRYAYPLLYPPLIEFCIQLPPELRRSQGIMAVLARRYINLALPDFRHNTKPGPFVGSMAQKCRNYMNQGLFDMDFKDLAFAVEHKYLPDSEIKLLIYIRAYMLKYYQTSTHVYDSSF